MLARPGEAGVVANLQQQVELFGEKVIVVGEPEAEEREGFGEGASSGDDFGAALGDEVQGGEFLKDANGIGGREHGDGGGEANLPCARGGSGEDDGGRGVKELSAVMFADAEDVEADLVGQFNLFEEIAQALGGRDGDAGFRVLNGCCEAVDANLHLGCPFGQNSCLNN